jgi:hypothetical protein
MQCCCCRLLLLLLPLLCCRRVQGWSVGQLWQHLWLQPADDTQWVLGCCWHLPGLLLLLLLCHPWSHQL